MTRRTAISALAFAFVIGYGKIALAQSLSQITLKIDPQNAAEYQDDIGDVSQFASKAISRHQIRQRTSTRQRS
jgi:hypothetical protein